MGTRPISAIGLRSTISSKRCEPGRRSTCSSTTRGRSRRDPAAGHRDRDWDDVLEVNLTAQFVLTREIGRTMLERGAEDRVHRLSPLLPGRDQRPRVRGEQGWDRAADEGLRERVGPRRERQRGGTGVHRDRQHAGAARRSGPPRQILERIPAGRWGSAADIAGAVLFLASPAVDYVHGVVLPVDGGGSAGDRERGLGCPSAPQDRPRRRPR